MERPVADDDRCFCCGKDNPQGLHLAFAYPGEGRAQSEFRIPEHFSGWREMTHGGLLAMVLDEAMAHACMSYGTMGITAELGVRFLKPARVGDTVKVSAEIVSSRARVLEARGTITNEAGEELARGSGRFVRA
jgi:uncharacterized protein (TIGR00369 family)